MGYYTIHAIRIVNKYNTRKNLKKLLKVIKIISGYSFEIRGSTITDFSNLDDFGCKWYECRHDMCAVSRLLPKLKIEVCGKGEEEGDEWSCTFENGFEHDEGEFFINDKYYSDFEDDTDSNHCSIVSFSSSDDYDSEDDK